MPGASVTSATLAQPPGGARAFGPVLLAMPLALWLLWPSFGSMLEQWSLSSTFNYGFLIAPISAVLVWRERLVFTRLPVAPTLVPVLLAVPVAAAWAIGLLLRVELAHHAAAVALLVLTIWAGLGHRLARALAFPLAYLFLMVPFGEFLVPYLMRLTADFAVLAVQASGVPVYQDGYVFSLPSGDFEVIKACSGIRFLMATIAAGTVFAWVAYRSLRKRLVFLALCVIVPVIGNLLRAYGVVMAVHLSDMRFAAGGDHVFYGTLFYAAILLTFFVLAARFADLPEPVSRSVGSSSLPAAGRAAMGPLLAILLLLAGTAAVPALAARRAAQSADAPAATLTPQPGWLGPVPADAGWQPSFPAARAVVSARYAPLDDALRAVDVHVAEFTALGASADLTSSVNRLYQEPEWRELAARSLVVAGAPVQELHLRSSAGEQRLVWWWYRVAGRDTTDRLTAQWWTLKSLFSARPPIRALIATSVPLTVSGKDAGEKSLAEFIAVSGATGVF